MLIVRKLFMITVFTSTLVCINQRIIFCVILQTFILLHTFLLFYLNTCVSERHYIFLFAFLSVGLIYRERNKKPKLGKYIGTLNGFPGKSCQATFKLSKPWVWPLYSYCLLYSLFPYSSTTALLLRVYPGFLRSLTFSKQKFGEDN